MIIRKATIQDAQVVKRIIREAYLPLLEKYHDEKGNPANKTIENILYDLQRPNSDAYVLILNNESIGYVRIGQRGQNEMSVADLAILPEHQNNGYAQHFLKEIEKMYPEKTKWSLVTINEEEKDCHLYEKLGYQKQGIIQEVNKDMHFVLFIKPQ